MLTTESYPADAFEQWQLAKDNPFIIGEFVWTAMDYLGESGIGAWVYGTPEQAAQAGNVSAGISNFVDQYFIAMANGVDPMAAMAQKPDPAIMSVMTFLMPGYPWHAAQSGDLDLTGYRKPQSYYRDILWNGGDRVYATVRQPEPEGKKLLPWDGRCIQHLRVGTGRDRKARRCKWKSIPVPKRCGSSSMTN
jgi:beta-galactosidase